MNTVLGFGSGTLSWKKERPSSRLLFFFLFCCAFVALGLFEGALYDSGGGGSGGGDGDGGDVCVQFLCT